jgi:hypothetical protein
MPNANDFDQFPVYEPILKTLTNGGLTSDMSDVWRDSIATFYMNLIAYLTAGGILLPQLTSDQRDALLNVQNGQMIYNTTVGSAQYFKVGVWTSF